MVAADGHESDRWTIAWSGWQTMAGALVALGCIATAGYALVETFWG